MDSPVNGIERDAVGMYPSELDPATFRAKLERLTDRIHELTGIEPRSYRAGNYIVRVGEKGFGSGTRIELDTNTPQQRQRADAVMRSVAIVDAEQPR